MSSPVIRIQVAYLAGSRVEAGCATESLVLPSPSRVQDARRLIAERHPALALRLESVRFARNFEMVELDVILEDGDELGVLPPVCGGAPRALVTEAPIDAREVAASVAGEDAGATVLFVGTVRRRARGKLVEHIDYEAYEPMATRALEAAATELVREHGALDVRIVHRRGRVEVGEPAVVIAASGVHREEAFAACRAAIERIKRDVPIWKLEVGPDGARWEGWGGG